MRPSCSTTTNAIAAMGSSCRIDARCRPDGEDSCVDDDPKPPIHREPSERPTWVRWQIVAILMAFAGLNHFHRQSLPSVVGAVMHDCRLTETEMGWVYFAFLLG